MKYPKLNETGTRREMTDVFAGLDVNDRAISSGWSGNSRALGRWSWMENASCDKYPAAATREHRLFCSCPADLRAFAIIRDVNDEVKTVAVAPLTETRDAVYVNGVYAQPYPIFARERYPKHIVTLGKNVYFLRSDKNDSDEAAKVPNTFATAMESIEANFEYVSDTAGDGAVNVRYYPCDIDGNVLNVYYNTSRPPQPDSETYWVDRSGDDAILKKYSTLLGDWIPVSQAYIKILFPSSSQTGYPLNYLKEGDAVVISGVSPGLHSGSGDLRAQYNKRALGKLNTDGLSSVLVQSKGTNESGYPYIVVPVTDMPVPLTNYGYIEQKVGETLKIRRAVPVFEHVCAGENRIWGCDSDSNEIRCCKLGDPSNWNVYTGISTDSYAVTVGGETGRFTGAAFAFGNPIFFKENAVIRIYGTAPSNYRLTSISAPGVAAGSAKSAAVVSNYVFYLSPNGVCYYDGASVHEIGDPIGGSKLKNGVGAGADNKYYLSCEDEAGRRHLFVYDLRRNVWTREDSLRALFAGAVGNSVTFVEQTGADSSEVRFVTNRTDAPVTDASGDAQNEGAFDWELVSPIIGYESPDEKYISRFNIRLMMNAGARLDVFVRYDGDETWERRSSVTSFGRRSFTIPIRPRRCDHMQIRLAGHGDCVIYSLAKIYEKGSDEVR